jgi:hypothetical protein
MKTNCFFCSREITNPICSKCNFGHLLLWVNEKPIDFADRMKIIKKIKKNLFVETDNSLDCIICHNNEVAVCTFCFFRKVENILDGLNIPDEMINDFRLSFNFNIYSDYPQSFKSEGIEENSKNKIYHYKEHKEEF